MSLRNNTKRLLPVNKRDTNHNEKERTTTSEKDKSVMSNESAVEIETTLIKS